MNTLNNRVVLIGNLGNDPQVRHFENGSSIARMSIATTERFKTKDGESSERTYWHNVVAWNRQATYAEKFLRKGNRIAVEGKLESRSYEDKDKNTKYVTEVIARDFMSFTKNAE